MRPPLYIPTVQGLGALQDLPRVPWATLDHAYGRGVTGRGIHDDGAESGAAAQYDADMKPSSLVLAWCFAACAPVTSVSPLEPSMHTIEASEAQTHSSFDMDAARASVVPAGVSFHIDGPPLVDGRYVRLRGLLVNAAATPQTVTVFPAGPLGFFVEPAPGTATPRPPTPGEPPRPPPVPPPPLVITIPATTQIRIASGLSLDDYDWTGTAPHALAWSFLFWNEPKPRGSVTM